MVAPSVLAANQLTCAQPFAEPEIFAETRLKMAPHAAIQADIYGTRISYAPTRSALRKKHPFAIYNAGTTTRTITTRQQENQGIGIEIQKKRNNTKKEVYVSSHIHLILFIAPSGTAMTPRHYHFHQKAVNKIKLCPEYQLQQHAYVLCASS